MKNLNWQTIHYHEEYDADGRTLLSHEWTEKAEIFGGWLVKHTYVNDKEIRNESMTFVPDHSHSWNESE